MIYSTTFNRSLLLTFMISMTVFQIGCATTPSRPVNADHYLNYTDNNGLMLEGNDPVVMNEQTKLRQGSPAHYAEFKGGIYYFVSAENKDRFKLAPTKYAPLFGGHCAMSASMGKVEPSAINTFSYAEEHLVLQRNEKALNMWKMDVCGNLHKATENWPRLVREQGKSIQ